MTSSEIHTFDGVTVENNGITTINSSGNVFRLNGGAVFNNNNLVEFTNGSGTAVVDTATGAGGFFNNNPGAEVRKTGAGSVTFGNITLTSDNAAFNIQAGSINLAGAATFNNTLTVNASGFPLTFNSNSITFSDGSSINGNVDQIGGVVNITGAVTLNGVYDWKTASSTLDGSGVFTISAGSQLLLSDSIIHTFNTLTIENNGSTIVNSAGNVFRMNGGATFNNNNLVEFSNGSGTATVDTITGAGGFFNNNPGAEIRKTGAGAGIAEFGNITFTSDNATFNIQGGGSINLTGATVFNNTLTIDASGNALTFASNSITFNDGASINGNVNQVNGTVTITGATTLNGIYNWTGTSTLAGSGVLTVSSGSQLLLSNSQIHTFDSLTVENNGATIVDSSGNVFRMNGGAVFNNNALLEFSNISLNAVIDTITGAGGFVNNNPGAEIRKTGAGSVTFSNITLTSNDASFNVQDGSILLTGTTVFNNVLTIDATGSALTFASNNITFNDGSRIEGNVNQASGTVTIAGATTLNGVYDWTGASTLAGGGVLTVSPGSQLLLSNSQIHTFNSLTVNNNGSTIVDSSGNVFRMNGAATFNNNNLIEFTNGSGSAVIDSITGAGGVFNNNPGSELRIAGGGGVVVNSPVVFSNTAANINILSGSFSVSGVTLTLDTNSFLQGNGTYVGDVNNQAGTVSPGGSGNIGLLTITGNYTQGAAARLLIDLQGATNPGVDYDWLQVGGSATLDGVVAIQPVNGFAAAVNDNFTFLTATITTADFAKYQFPVGYALPNQATGQRSIDFTGNNTVFFDNFGGDFDWNNPLNWSTGALPVSGVDVDTVALFGGAGAMVISGGAFNINNLVVNSNLSNTGGSLTVTGNVTVPDNFSYTQNGATAFTQFDGVFNDLPSTNVAVDNQQGALVINGVMNAALTNSGNLSGAGEVNGDVANGGNFAPGDALGIFTVNGDLTLLPSSVLTVDIAGLAAGSQYDQLVVNGNIIYAGQLAVVVDSASYQGSINDDFVLISVNNGQGSGAFETVAATPGYAFAPRPSAAGLVVTATAVPGQDTIDPVGSDVITLTNTIESIDELVSGETDADLQTPVLRDDEEEEEGATLVCS